MPDMETTALIERLQRSKRRWKWLALSLLAAFGLTLVLLTTSLWVRAERQARQAEAAAKEARQQEQDARKLSELEEVRQHQGRHP
jgi:hypothetical protein